MKNGLHGVNDMYIEPSGFIGAAMAVQGIRDATVILHGQSGCRKGLLGSQQMMVRTEQRDMRFYSDDRAIPYSNIRPEDYYKNTLNKLEATMDHIDQEDYNLKVLMCSPGISLIGDDCRRVVRKDESTMLLDTDKLSNNGCAGFDECIHDILEFLDTEKDERIENGINIIGISIMHKDWASFLHEFTHLLKDAGFKIICTLGAGCTVEDIKRSVNASFNIIIDPEYAKETAELYRNRYGIQSISIGKCPVGFDAIEEIFKKIEETTGILPQHGISMLKKSKRRAYEGIVASGKNLSGKTFSIISTESTAVPLREFLINSFGMVECNEAPDYLFAPGNIALLEQASGRCTKGIDIGFPSSSGPEFLKKPLMGMEGVMYILDSMINRCDDRILLHGASSPGCGLCECPCPSN